MRFPAFAFVALLVLSAWTGFSPLASLMIATGVVGLSLALAHASLDETWEGQMQEASARKTLTRAFNRRKRPGGWPWDPR